MKDLFRGYYAPTPEDLDQMWNEGLIVLDTNALLNLFRYSKSTRDEFFMVLHQVAEQLWIPHQVGLEFQRRRLDVIEDQTKAYDDLDKAISDGKSGVIQSLNKFRFHPLLNKTAITEILDEGMKSVSDVVKQSRKDHEAQVLAEGENERVSDSISNLYTSRVGQPFDQATLAALYIEGAARYEAKVPPGYRDKTKLEPARYGDLVLWKQLLAQVSVDKKPALFVTDDAKEDWWRLVNGKTQGPRVELIDEYFGVAEQRVHFYSPDRFLQFAKKKFGIAVSDDSLSEVEEVSRGRSTYDTNSLFAERAHIQAIRNEAQKALLFDVSTSTEHKSEREQLERRIESLMSERAHIQNQIQLFTQGLDGFDERDRSAALNHIENLDVSLRELEYESAVTRDKFEQHSRNAQAHGSDSSRRASYESRLRAADDRMREIDDLIDGPS